MNYTKYLKNLKSNRIKEKITTKDEKFMLHIKDEKIKISIDILKDIKKTKLLIENFLRIGKIN